MSAYLKESELFSASDTPLAASLSALGFVIEAVDRSDPKGRVNFLFRHSKDLERAVEGFWKRQLSIEPQLYSQHLKFLKGRIYWDK